MKIYFDTNVIVSGMVPSHVHHARALAVLMQVQANEVKGVISAHGLAELYSVLSRTPFAVPVNPREAYEAISIFVAEGFQVVELLTGDYRKTIELCASHGWVGGRIHDALHIAAARKANCERIYTFNVGDFRKMALDLAHIVAAPY